MEPKIYIIGGGAVLLIGIILFALSFDSIEPTEWGLCYNTWTKTVYEDEIYAGGRYVIGFTNSFIAFPRNLRTIEFSDTPHAQGGSLKTRTKEGLSLGLELSFQYELIRNKIPKLYEISNVNFEQTFIRIARDTILQEAGNHQAPEYWTNRTQIGNTMREILDVELQHAYAYCRSLQIMKIILPDSYEQSIVDTQVEVQKTTMKGFEQQAEVVRQKSLVLQSECDQNITIIESSANAQAYFLKELAKSIASTNTLEMQAYVYSQAIDLLGFSQEEFSEYLFLRSVKDKDNATVVVGVDSAMIQVKG
ncbi:unnamed protein product [Blepharisma stoltei]|uniref:Band 7 domain-containing protein n=1 Tax=Blepharisma stoltei TaxID=1481888 RepID=A0AAU9K395_9CILI|nr:unnamed protein product [Blepharisma stoltei]